MLAAAGSLLDRLGAAVAVAGFAVAALAGARPVSAGSPIASDFGGSIAVASDYVYHGLSRTCGGPAAQAGFHFGTAGGQAPEETFAGVWGSAGLGGDYCRKSREIDLYAGERLALTASQNISLTYVHYAFPGGTDLYEPLEGRRFDYDELGVSWAFEDRVDLTLAWTPNAMEYVHDTIERGRTALSFGGELHQPIGARITVSAGAGYDEVADLTGAGFVFWNAGVGRTVGPVQIDVSYFRTAPRAERLFGPQIAGGRVAATAVWRF